MSNTISGVPATARTTRNQPNRAIRYKRGSDDRERLQCGRTGDDHARCLAGVRACHEEHRVHTDEWVSTWHAAVMENFDLNMAYFAQIEPGSFEMALTDMLAANPKLRPVTDLASLDGVEGVYVMVLDQYRQAYIGKAYDIRGRIKSHWNGTKQFDRLLWGHKHLTPPVSTRPGPPARTRWRPGWSTSSPPTIC